MTDCPDPIIAIVRGKLLARSVAGIAKYGTTLARQDLDRRAWLLHLQDELLDAAAYIERLLQDSLAAEHFAMTARRAPGDPE